MKYQYNDGGRAAAGFAGAAGDCVVRAVAIATEQPYAQVYEALANVNAGARSRSRIAGKRSARSGVLVGTAGFKRYMQSLGWVWTPTMRIGSGCTVHLTDGELPAGRLIVSVSKHYTAVIDGVIHDTHDPRRTTLYYEDGVIVRRSERCVYGYWEKMEVRL